jgi:hypothetical protein
MIFFLSEGVRMVEFHNKVFKCRDAFNHRDITNETMFFYKQNGAIIQAKYYGGRVKYGELIGLITDKGVLQISFNHSNTASQYSGGVGTFIPETGKNQQIMLQGKWTWGDGTNLEEEFIMEEISL